MSEPSAPVGPAVLIAAASGRALAAAARRAGFSPLTADLFGDDDARALSAASRRVGDWREGFSAVPLIAALDELSDGREPIGLVYGAGFEDRIEILDELGERWPLLGTPPAVARRAKDPLALAALCRALAIPHPDTRLDPPENPEGWLAKARGGAGGAHILPAAQIPSAAHAPDDAHYYYQHYYQRRVAGEPASVLLLCAGGGARALGLSRQWAAPAPDSPFRYGGCLRPADLAKALEERLVDAAGRLAAALGARGLVSVDFLVEGDAFHLIEVNPRPGATLDIYEDRDGRLFAAHVEACRDAVACAGQPPAALAFEGAAAAAVAYARSEISIMPTLDWPEWAADRQSPRSFVGAGEPICTVTARAGEPLAVRALIETRLGALADAIQQETGRQAP
ncbi:ATP-grasp domain-containing protein [Methylocella sp.]|uniref:ATP-grasp domain-containing protein n=1 Tax=Methylocella sp. TaxID=1978226 RepID=UPI0035AEFBAF